MRYISERKLAAAGLVSGAVNGLFGSGGGMVAVPMLEREGVEPKQAHVLSLSLMLTFSLVSAAVYTSRGGFEPFQAVKYLPGGVAGSVVGWFVMKRISSLTLQKVFSCVMIYFGVRMLMN